MTKISAKRASEAEVRRRSPWVIGAMLGALIVAVYLRSLGADFVLDDDMSVTDNFSIRRLGDLGTVLSPPETSTVGGRPVANLSFALNFAVSRLEPRGYRITNLAIHLAAALWLFGILRRTLQHLHPGRSGWGCALAVAGLWALHPVQTATVAYVSQRTEQLMALFYLLTIYCFVRSLDGPGRSRRWLACSVAACALGMGSKEVMVTAPMLVLLYDRTFAAGSFAAAWRTRWRYYCSLAATWLVLAALMTTGLNQRAVGFGLGITGWEYFLTECRAVLLYAKLAFWPHPLVFDYGPVFFKRASEALPYVAAVGVLAAGVLRASIRRPALGFLLAGFFIVLAPTSSIVPVATQPIAESRMYLPLAFAMTLLVVAVHRVMQTRANVALAAAACAMAWVALGRNHVIADPIRLWRDTLAKQPDNARAHSNLAAAFAARGETDAVIEHSREVLRRDPKMARAHTNLAAALLKKGHPEEALQHGSRALQLSPGMTDTNYQIGNALVHLGRVAEAIPHYQAEIRIRPDYADAYSNLGAALYMLGRPAEAVEPLETAVRLDPRSDNARDNLASALAQAGRRDEAIAIYRASLQGRPNNAGLRCNLAVVLAQAGRYAEAEAEFRAALQVQPDHEPARRGLAEMQALLRGR